MIYELNAKNVSLDWVYFWIYPSSYRHHAKFLWLADRKVDQTIVLEKNCSILLDCRFEGVCWGTN